MRYRFERLAWASARYAYCLCAALATGQGLPPDKRIKINVAPNYHALHWHPPHVNGVEFAELDSYDIRGLSAMRSEEHTSELQSP